MEYRVLHEKCPQRLSEVTTAHINDGFSLVGSVEVVVDKEDFWFFQSVVSDTSKSKDEKLNSTLPPNNTESEQLNHKGHSIKRGDSESTRDYCRDCKEWI